MFMKRKEVAIAISALLVPIATQASELTIYGSVGAAVEQLDNGTRTTTNVSDNHSALGFEGGTDIGNGIKGVFHFDAFVDIDQGGGNTQSGFNGSLIGGGRDGWVGLNGESWGTVALGFQGRPWKTSTASLDVFEGTIADYSAIMGRTPDAYFDSGIGSSVIWFAPRVYGISGQAQYGADENHDGSNDWGAQVNYANGPLYLVLSYDVDGRASPEKDVTATKAAGSYTFMGNLTATAIFETIKDSPINSRNAWYVAGKYMITDSTGIKAAFAMADKLDSGSDTGAKYWAIGATQKLNKDLEVFGLYSAVNNDSNATYTFITDPSTSTNPNTDMGSIAPGKDSNVFAVGVKYNFSNKVM
jgi:predicted porin